MVYGSPSINTRANYSDHFAGIIKMDGRYLEFHKCLSNSNYLINVALVEDLNNIDAVRHLIIQNRLGVTLINATMVRE